MRGDEVSQTMTAGSSSAPGPSNTPQQGEEKSSASAHAHANGSDRAAPRAEPGSHPGDDPIEHHSGGEEPHVSTHKGSKPCTLCHTPRDVLIRCQIDDTKKWHFICTGKCWKGVSGGVVDGDGVNGWYRYGGMWKNKHEGVSAKLKGKAKKNKRGKIETDVDPRETKEERRRQGGEDLE